MSIRFNADEVFEIGMAVELNGKTFYDEASRLCETPEVRGVLEILRDQEQEHYEAFAAMREKLPPDAALQAVFDPNDESGAYLKALADSHVFTSQTQAGDVARECENERDILRLALRFEKDSVLVFQTMKELTKAEWGGDRIDWLIEAEKEHVRQIAGVLAALDNLGA